MKSKTFSSLSASSFSPAFSGCVNANFKLFTDASDPLKEQTLSGQASGGKVLMIRCAG
jgi:hypothetical protein